MGEDIPVHGNPEALEKSTSTDMKIHKVSLACIQKILTFRLFPLLEEESSQNSASLSHYGQTERRPIRPSHPVGLIRKSQLACAVTVVGAASVLTPP